MPSTQSSGSPPSGYAPATQFKMGTMRSLLTIALTLAGTVSASARDRLDADWGADCGRDVQCWLEIRPMPAISAYTVRYVAADGKDASAIHCEAKGNIRVSGDVDTFIGTLAGRKLTIRRTAPAEIAVSGGTLCGCSFKVDGKYGPIRD